MSRECSADFFSTMQSELPESHSKASFPFLGKLKRSPGSCQNRRSLNSSKTVSGFYVACCQAPRAGSQSAEEKKWVAVKKLRFSYHDEPHIYICIW